jgi:2-dehydro-3-deoxy-D-arabinonate dehydratase
MILTKNKTTNGSHWAVDDHFLPPNLNLSKLLEMPREKMFQTLRTLSEAESAIGDEEAPIDPYQEVWAAGVTYLRSRDARKEESDVADIYQKVYEAERPEIFPKSLGWRVSGNRQPIRIRKDSRWNVPEPELVLVINSHNEIVGYCAGIARLIR